MTSSIQRLFRTLVKEMQQRDLAEERQFQSQIQPHFLYNSLFYIVSVADQPQDVRKMTRHLAEYYRYLSKAKDRVCIQDEVEFARHYLSIQALRKDFQFQISLEDHVGQELILPLLIQPIIENAIEHGIEAKDGAHQINLSVKRENSGIHISVSDDGPGMLLDDLETLYHFINQPHHQGGSIGLWNVNQRLKNAYGKEAGLHLKINDLGGLTIHFTINKESGGTYRSCFLYQLKRSPLSNRKRRISQSTLNRHSYARGQRFGLGTTNRSTNKSCDYIRILRLYICPTSYSLWSCRLFTKTSISRGT